MRITRIVGILAAGLLMAACNSSNEPQRQATVVNGYFEGYVSGSDVYANGTPVRVDFTYTIEAAPIPICYDSPDNVDACPYEDVNGPDWLTSSLTIGSDTYEFGLFGDQYRRVYLVDGDGVDYPDNFSTYQQDHSDELVDGVATYSDTFYTADFRSVPVDFINGTALPTSLDITSGPNVDGHGAWQQYSYVSDNNTSEQLEESFAVAFFLFDRLVILEDVP